MKSRHVVVATTLMAMALGVTHPAAAQPQSITITNPASDVAFDAADEYNTLAWNHPLDMSEPLDIQQLDSGHAVYPNHFNAYSPCAAGLWCGQVRPDVGDPDLFLLKPGYRGALHVGRDGNLRPINAGQYTRLTFRMWLDQVPAGSVGWQVMWTTGTVSDFCNPSVCGQTVFFPLFQGWNIYSIDLSTSLFNGGGMPWSGNITGLRLDVGNANMQGHIVYLDWARLSGSNGDNRQIGWNTSEGGSVTVELMSSDGVPTPYRPGTKNSNLNAGQIQSIPANAGTYQFQGSLPAEDWRIKLSTSSNSFATSPGRWLVQAAPTLSFVKPSYTSGADYATVVKGDPWDMNNEQDVGGGVVNAQNPSFSNGSLSATSETSGNTICVPGNCNPAFSDPQIWFLTNPLPPAFNINTTRFRYITFRMMVAGEADISYGYIARVIWPYPPCGISNDIPLHTGWNVVSLDLWGNILDDQSQPGCNSTWLASSARTELRLDPHEVPIATTFYLDYVLLTAMDTASMGADFPVEYVPGRTTDSVTFYYNTSRTIDGRQRANGGSQFINLPRGFNHFYFFPFIPKQLPTGGPPGTQTFFWHLAGVSPNTYYLSADISDGSKTTTWFSDTPVVVTP